MIVVLGSKKIKEVVFTIIPDREKIFELSFYIDCSLEFSLLPSQCFSNLTFWLIVHSLITSKKEEIIFQESEKRSQIMICDFKEFPVHLITEISTSEILK